MKRRRKSRELAMQALFAMDASHTLSEAQLDTFCENFMPAADPPDFFLKLVKGVLSEKVAIDSFIERFSSNWKIGRMSCVDRNILRVAVYEMRYCPDIPAKVSINEAIDIGKKYGSEESGAFINGILDSIRLALEKSDPGQIENSRKGPTIEQKE